MKTCVALLLLVMVAVCIQAENIDDELNAMFDNGGFYTNSEGNLFISSYYEESVLPDIFFAENFINQTAFLFLMVQQDWKKEYEYNHNISEVKQTDIIACPFAGKDTDFMLVMNMYHIKSQLTPKTYRWPVNSEIRAIVKKIVTENALIEPLSDYK